MQAATTTTGNAALDSVVAIIVAVGIIAGVAAPILKRFSGRLNTVGQLADTFSQKTGENTEEMYRALAAARSVVPELDAALKKYEVPLSKIETRVETAAEQLDYFRDKIPQSAHASSVTSLPRENFKVDIKKRHTYATEDDRAPI